MTFEEIIQEIQKREAKTGRYLDDFSAKRLAAIEIVEGFRTIGEARDSIKILKETGNHLFTATGYEVDYQCLQKAVDMFFPSRAKGSAKQSMDELFV